jgi:phage tail-like protein
MKKGVFAKDNGLWKWFSQNKMNTVKRVTVVVSLLDETGAPTMVWTLANAFAAKIGSTDLKADGNEVAIESLEIAHEGITIANG